MGKTKFLFGALGILALGFSSCSSDEPLGYQDQKVEKTETRYLSVALCNPTSNASRADEFDYGTDKENEINTLIFVFYDGSGAPVGQPVNLDKEELTVENGWTMSPNATGQNVARVWESTIPVDLTQGENKPVYVMCYVNPINNIGLTDMTLAEVDAATRTAVIDGNGYFAMSNSVYYGNNPITGQSNVRMMATPIVGDILATTPEAAKENPAVEIYVERYSAKVGLTLAPTALTTGYDVITSAGVETTIQFTPTFWRTNAIDQTTYITKGFSTSVGDSDPTKPATYAALTLAFQNTGMAGEGLNGWNNQENFRSYWACSPSYYAGKYPACSDDITDITNEGGAYPYSLKYYTYNEIANSTNTKAVKAWDTTTGFTGSLYTRETTASIENLRGVDAEGAAKPDFNQKAVPASIVIVGNYKIAGATGNATTFFLYGKNKNKDVYYADETAVKTALISNQNVIFANEGGTQRATNPASFKVEHPSLAVRTIPAEEGDDATVEKVPGRLVTIQIDKNNIPEGLYFNNGGENLEPVTTLNVDAANRLLWKSASTAQKFEQGLAFFAIPIRHLGWDDTVDLVENAGDNGRPNMINWPALRRGDLGVVRNHVYSYNVTAVTGLGIGLGSVDQPIVPPMDPDNYYIAAKLNILQWRVVPTQNVTL